MVLMVGWYSLSRSGLATQHTLQRVDDNRGPVTSLLILDPPHVQHRVEGKRSTPQCVDSQLPAIDYLFHIRRETTEHTVSNDRAVKMTVRKAHHPHLFSARRDGDSKRFVGLIEDFVSVRLEHRFLHLHYQLLNAPTVAIGVVLGSLSAVLQLSQQTASFWTIRCAGRLIANKKHIFLRVHIRIAKNIHISDLAEPPRVNVDFMPFHVRIDSRSLSVSFSSRPRRRHSMA
jgi:hypothetical protein